VDGEADLSHIVFGAVVHQAVLEYSIHDDNMLVTDWYQRQILGNCGRYFD
jgi:hypothetical protein